MTRRSDTEALAAAITEAIAPVLAARGRKLRSTFVMGSTGFDRLADGSYRENPRIMADHIRLDIVADPDLPLDDEVATFELDPEAEAATFV